MRYPEIDRCRCVVEADGQLGEDAVTEIDPGARENESGVTWWFAGRWLFRERTELAGHLR